MGIPLDEAELLGTLLEGVLYGFSLLMFGGTIWQLLSPWSTQKVNHSMVTVASSLVLLSTAHLIIDITRIMEALIFNQKDPIAYLSDASQWTFVAKNYVYTIQSLIGDGVILYRCYMVWQSHLIILLPAIFWCAAGVAGIGASVQATQNSYFGGDLRQWVIAFYSTTLATNLSATALLAYRIWDIQRRTTRLSGQQSQLRKIVLIIIDAGVIYNLSLIAAWICFSCESYSQIAVQDMIVPIISITFYTVILCVKFISRVNQPVRSFSLGHTSTGNTVTACPGDRVQVHITTLTENKVDDFFPSMMSDAASSNGDRRTPVKFDGGYAV